MIKILAIGNSFSQDATTYLHDIAIAGNKDIKVVNLYIGGCSLERHWNNIIADASAYEYQINGRYEGRNCSIKEALLEEEWDYVTLQQVSNDCGLIDTFYPYIRDIYDYVAKLAPTAIQLIHQTWAYELDSDHSAFEKYHRKQIEMYDALTKAYEQAAKDLSLDIIPSGTVIQTLRSLPAFDYAQEGISLCRDGFHMSLIYGRYATAATWYEKLLRGNILENSFLPPVVEGVSADPSLLELIKETVHKVVSNNE